MHMKNLSIYEAAESTLRKLSPNGLFLTVRDKDKSNTMTIGWGSIGIIWGKHMFTVLVREERYTHGLLGLAKEFTISVPTKDPLKEALLFAGTKSGRDVDKFHGHGLTAVPGQAISTPVVKECGLHFECRTLLAQDITNEQMSSWVKDLPLYKNGRYHTLFFGEIVACYTTDEL